MTQMWGMFALLSILAALFVVVPFLRREKIIAVDSDANAERIAIYQQRLDDLEQEFADKKIEQIAYNESIVELKRRLLNELSPEKQLNARGNNRIFALTGLAFLVAVSAVFYGFTGSQKQIGDWYTAIDRLPEFGERAVLQQGEPLSQNELQAFALGLRTKLAESGDDAVAWMLLGRVAMSLGDNDMAKQAFEKALVMQPDNNNVLVNFSQVLLIEGTEPSMNRAARMLSKVLQSDPSNMDAISLLALIAYERQDWEEAKAAFEVLQSSMTQDDPRYAMISERIHDIEHKINPDAHAHEESQPPAGASLTVSVSLNDSIASQLPDNATLFIFAKAHNGPPMPLAVNKLKQFQFPITVTLDDSMAMMPDLKLSNFEKVEITARVSSDEAVTVQAGDLEGQSDVIALDNAPSIVRVEISRVITSTGS
ncbi:c-type cytochrome biogenesis protein CcmI [Pseudoalteromonas phenolica]|uniref:C-type cytochrome biogenesis protein CcmI n=1 Tax=Pseudoalteromonas phenolica TaxID=161398 RepID=A0A5S3YXB5_9GAMM|nr:c-type cytochrome biogenesis protein CcmI [Pseudoalteromonas phenolica]TMP82971.1 c-type cytochrome biogenesis protein CcmI [Pseudoalteromonas phenolica]